MTAPMLLSLDEARDMLGSSAIALVEAVSCRPSRLTRLLRGRGTVRGLSASGRAAVRAHAAALRYVIAAGHGWILDEQVEGALSFAECLTEPVVQTVAA